MDALLIPFGGPREAWGEVDHLCRLLDGFLFAARAEGLVLGGTGEVKIR